MVPGPRQFPSPDAAEAAVVALLASHTPWPGLEDGDVGDTAAGGGGDGGAPVGASASGGPVLAARLREEFRSLLGAAVDNSRRYLARSVALGGLGGLGGLRSVKGPSPAS
jgi:hypothetical protein